MYKIYFLVTIFSLLILTGCQNNSEKKTTAKEQEIKTEELQTFDELLPQISMVKLPVFLPDDESQKLAGIAHDFIKKHFTHKAFTYPKGFNRDMPDIAEIADGTTMFFSTGKYISKDSFVVLFITKNQKTEKGTNEYTYIITTNAKGDFISGICAAFTETDKDYALKRTASVNEDLSIEMVQTETSAGKQQSPLKFFFETDHNGLITAIEKKI